MSARKNRSLYMLFALMLGLGGVFLSGCAGAVAPSPPPQLKDVQKIQVGGLERTYRVFVPPTSGTTPLPLVMVFHGGGMTSMPMAKWTAIHDVAAREGFMVVYADGTRTLGLFGTWNVGSATPQVDAEKKGIDDVAFVRALIEKLRTEHRIDPRRIYATGVSLGGMFSYHLACSMSETFAAVAVVAGGMTTAKCNPVSPVAILVIHGIDDQHVPVAGGRGRHTSKNRSWPAVSKGLEFWGKENGCQGNRKEIFHKADATCWTFGPCSSKRPVEYCSVEGGHHWPGQGKRMLWQKLINEQISSFPASERIWAFFKANPK